MTDYTTSLDRLPAEPSSAEVDEAHTSATASSERNEQRVFGFGDGGRANCPLLLINPNADPVCVNDFIQAAERALDELLSEAVLHDGMEGNRAWLVEFLVQATRGATERAYCGP